MSFAAQQRDRGQPVLPLAAMVDILFLLLIFFLTASALREEERSIEVELEQTGSGQAGAGVSPVIITVTENDEIYIGQQLYTPEALRGALGAIAETTPGEAIVIRGDKNSKLGTAERILDIAYAVGMTNVRLATQKRQEGG